MKIVVVGDLHGCNLWRDIINKEVDADKVIMIGDYLDSFDISGVEQLHNLKEIIEYKENNMDKVILLIGNHDMHYFSFIGYTGTSGYQNGMKYLYGQILDGNIDLFQMAHKEGNILFSHAGIGHTWLTDNGWAKEDIVEYVNDVWKYRPKCFEFNGIEPSGNDLCQTPVWIRPKSLMRDTRHNLAKDYIQVFGHTQMRRIVLDILGGRLIDIDTIHAREYLIIEDGIISVGTI